MPTLTNPVACPTCHATTGERCTTRRGTAAARPHKARMDARIPVGRHTDDCRTAAVVNAVENIADWDTRTRANHGTDPIEWADRWLDDGINDCLCWTPRHTPMTLDRIRTGARIIAEHANTPKTTYQSYSVQFVDADGQRLTGSPWCEYQAHDPRTAATLAAEGGLPGNPIVTVTGTDDGNNGGTWTFTPSTGAPVRVNVTPAEPATLIAHGPERAPGPAPERTLVGHVTIARTNPNWAATFAMADEAAAAAEDTVADALFGRTWTSALANLRDALQEAGVPPETTDSLVIRHEGKDSWLTDVRTGHAVMHLESPNVLEDAQYGMAWLYRQGRPQIIRTEPIPYAERASQRPTAAV